METKIQFSFPLKHDGKRATAALLALALTLLPPLSFANPQNGTVSAGQATISQNGTKLDVHQSTDKAVIDWRSFDIEASEHTQFHQPSASSMALNRVNSNDPSKIMGQLTTNGKVILVNPNGIFFGKNAKVDVAGIVATTSNIRNNDFMAGVFRLFQPGNNQGKIVNDGSISAKEAGLIGLVAPYVENNGTISAKLGKVTLASGDSFTLDMAGDTLIEVAVTGDLSRQLVSNQGTIHADGGTVTLTAAAARGLVNGVVSNSGVITANRFKQKDGTITLYAKGSNAVKGNIAADKGNKTGTSTALNSGILTATGDKGGTVKVLGDHVGLLSGSRIDVSGKAGGGTALIGGDYQGNGNTPTAKRTIIQPNTTIHADATHNGKGGKVIAWADDRTDFSGNISARGGAQGGDGGFIETSGKQLLSVSGLADASSPKGNAGSWLLDPNDVTIQTAGAETNVSASPNFTTTNDTAIVTTGSIETALNAGTSVTITTSTGGANTQLGNITVANAIAKTAGGDATLTLSAHNSIIIAAAANISSNTGKLHIVLNADSDADSAGAIAITSATLTSNGGNITLGGGASAAASAWGTASNVSGITLTSSTLTSGAGNIILRGHGYNHAAADRYGISLSASTAQTTSGTLTITGVGGNGTSSNYGVNVSAAGVVTTTVSGNITVTGTGGNGSGSNNHGIFVSGAGSTISSTGSGTLTVNGTGGNTGHGIRIVNTGVITTTTSGNLSVTGIGGTGTTGLRGISIANANSTISASGSGTLTVYGMAGNGSNVEHVGIYLDSGKITSSSSGNVSVTGIGNGHNSDDNYGVAVMGVTGAISATGSGTLTVNGTGGNGNVRNHGVGIYDGKISTTTSALVVMGTGGSDGTSGSNYGIEIWDGEISSVSGAITVTGTGAASTQDNYGINHRNNGIITTGSGNLTVIGTGGNGTGSANGGIKIWNGATISSTGSGTVTVNGTGGTGTSDNYGIWLTSTNGISTVNSNVTITATGGNGSSTGNYGMYLQDNITATGSGNITLTSTGRNGAVDLFDNGARTIGGAGATGAITLIQDSATWGGLILNTSGSTVIKQRSSTTTLGIAGGAGTLGVTSAFLDAILRSSDITIGDSAGSGVVTVNTYTWGRPVTIQTATGGITFNGATALGANTLLARTHGLSDITLAPASSITTSAAGNAIILASGRNFINNSNNSVLSMSAGRSLIYSTDPANDIFGGILRPTKLYSKTYASYAPGAVTELGNVFLYSNAEQTPTASGGDSPSSSQTPVTIDTPVVSVTSQPAVTTTTTTSTETTVTQPTTTLLTAIILLSDSLKKELSRFRYNNRTPETKPAPSVIVTPDLRVEPKTELREAERRIIDLDKLITISHELKKRLQSDDHAFITFAPKDPTKH